MIRRALGAVAVAAAVACLAGCGGGGGVEMVRLPVADDPTVSFKVWVRAGSQDDPAGKEGLAYLTGRMLSEAATENRPYEQILRDLYPLAAGYGARVDREMTVVSGRVHRDNVDAYLELFLDAVLRPAFAENDFRRVRSDALNEIRNSLRYQSDEELGKAALAAFVFEGTPYEHPPVGTESGLDAITLDDVREFYRARFVRGNVVAAIGGGFDDALAQRFAAALAALPEGDVPPTPAPEPPAIERNRVVIVDKPDADASISFGYPIDVLRGERDFYALWIANSWLGEHRNSSSHLYQVIREERGMNYGDYSYIEAFPEGGSRQFPPPHVGRRVQMFEVWIRTLPSEQAIFALRAAVRELDRLVDQGMTPEEFELTRSFLGKYALHYADTTQARLGFAVDDRFYGIEGEGHLERFRRMMDELTVEDVNDALRRHLRAERMKIAIVSGGAEELAGALASGAPSPLDYGSEKDAAVLAEDEEIATFPLPVERDAIRILPVDQAFR